MRIKWHFGAVLSMALVVAGCTVTVGGSASPVPGQGPVKKVVDACTLLTKDEVEALGFKMPGRSVPASEERRTPSTCLWSSADDQSSTVILSAGWSVDQTLDDYLSGAVAKSSAQQLGGLSWTQYGSILPDDCNLYTTLGEKSFAFVGVTAGEATKSCDLAKTVTPVVASHLPGGAPAPSITPSSSGVPEPSGPLMSLDPCTLLKPDQLAQLTGISPNGEKTNSKVTPNASYCLWKDTDGDGGQKAFEVWLGPSTPAKKWIGADAPPTETKEIAGKTWSIYPNMAGLRVDCAAIVPITETSSVQVVSGFIGDDGKTCDLLKAGLPLVTANLPS